MLAILESQVVYTTGYIRELSCIYNWLYQRVESYIQPAISESRVVYTTGYIRELSRIYNRLYQRVESYIYQLDVPLDIAYCERSNACTK